AGDIGEAEQPYDLSLTVVTGAPVPPGTATSIIAPAVTVTPGAPTKAVEPTKPPVPTPTQASVPPTPTPIPTTRLAQVVPTAPAGAGPTPPPQVVVVPTEEVPGVPNTGAEDPPQVSVNSAKPPQSKPQNSLSYAPMLFRVFYDANSNRAYDNGEGIRGIQVQFLKNQAETTGKLVTDNDGTGRLTLPILEERIYIP